MTTEGAPLTLPTVDSLLLVQVHVRELQAFLAVAETGSISGAAQLLFLDASTVGKLLTRLERHLDTKLAVRSTRRVILTDAGHRAVPAVQAVLVAVEALAEQVRDSNQTPIAVTSTM